VGSRQSAVRSVNRFSRRVHAAHPRVDAGANSKDNPFCRQLPTANCRLLLPTADCILPTGRLFAMPLFDQIKTILSGAAR